VRPRDRSCNHVCDFWLEAENCGDGRFFFSSVGGRLLFLRSHFLPPARTRQSRLPRTRPHQPPQYCKSIHFNKSERSHIQVGPWEAKYTSKMPSAARRRRMVRLQCPQSRAGPNHRRSRRRKRSPRKKDHKTHNETEDVHLHPKMTRRKKYRMRTKRCPMRMQMRMQSRTPKISL